MHNIAPSKLIFNIDWFDLLDPGFKANYQLGFVFGRPIAVKELNTRSRYNRIPVTGGAILHIFQSKKGRLFSQLKHSTLNCTIDFNELKEIVYSHFPDALPSISKIELEFAEKLGDLVQFAVSNNLDFQVLKDALDYKKDKFKNEKVKFYDIVKSIISQYP